MNTTQVRKLYDRHMYLPRAHDRFEHTDFFNNGYWLPGTRTQREACENLMERLLAFIPEKRGAILDVGCGKGATTRHLLRYYHPDDVVAINISAKQLATAARNAPGCDFLMMDAVKLAFQDCCFDNVICVEAAHHFNTKEDFFREAWRVLKPGGRLVLADVLHGPWGERVAATVRNYVGSVDEYRASLRRAGFEEAEIIDATEECWRRYYAYYWRWALGRLLAEWTFDPVEALIAVRLNLSVRRYLLVAASKT